MNTNVNDLITDNQLDNLRHTLGLNYKAEPYRNHYVADKTCSVTLGMMDMVDKGLMTCRPEPFGGDGICFHATESGKSYAMERQPKPKRKTNYDTFLSANTHSSFSEFLGIDKPTKEQGSGSNVGMVRIVSSRAKGEWSTSMILAKSNYTAELAKKKFTHKNSTKQVLGDFCQEH
jgi:hypothetical protein